MPAVDKERQAARFAQMWNKIITSFRKEDLISDRCLIDFLTFFGPWKTIRNTNTCQLSKSICKYLYN